jgi:DNA gyrase/topoisomerase IV subunit B
VELRLSQRRAAKSISTVKHFSPKTVCSTCSEKKTNVEKIRYPIIHLTGEDVEVAITHGDHYGEQYYSFVNGQNTTQGGTHLNAFREALVKTVRDHFKKNLRCQGYPGKRYCCRERTGGRTGI